MTAQDLLKPPQTYRLTTRDYLMLHEAGAFAGKRTELIGGEIYVVSPQARRHMFIKSELAYRLRRAVEEIGLDLFVGVDASVEVGEHDMPEPDIFLTSEARGDGYVQAEMVALLVEVAVTSRDHDLGRKVRLYSEAGIPEYWVVDAERAQLVQMWSPEASGYARKVEHTIGDVVEAASIRGLRVGTEGLA